MTNEYRKKPVVISAWQWIKLGDVSHAPITPIDSDTDWECSYCGNKASAHGNCKTLEGFHIVCPSDWIIKGVKGEFYPCKPDIFEMTYEPVKASPTPNVEPVAWLAPRCYVYGKKLFRHSEFEKNKNEIVSLIRIEQEKNTSSHPSAESEFYFILNNHRPHELVFSNAIVAGIWENGLTLDDYKPLYTHPAPPNTDEQLKKDAEQLIYDFGGFLTTRKERLVCSSADNASPMVEAIKEFLELRSKRDKAMEGKS